MEEILRGKVASNHVHIYVSVPSYQSISKIVQYLKGKTSRKIQQDFPKYCKLPEEKVQMDVCKIAGGLYQYTAIDDCTRYKILALYIRRTALNTLDFLEQVMDRIPFPIQRIQTDRGQEFFTYEVQEKLMEYGINSDLLSLHLLI
jgi:transposase InsO family protein